MKNIILSLLLTAIIGSSCSSVRSVFAKKTPHEKYQKKLDENDLEKTAIGRQWLAASKKALEEPLEIQLPYKHTGLFQTDKPRALGLKFKARKGEQLIFTLNKKVTSGFVLYTDIFKSDNTSSPLFSADTSATQFAYDIDETGTYTLRLQPELFRTGEYSFSVSVGPSLGFPIGANKGKVGSFWGASRDGGKRTHEGIDIFAPKGTPAVAGCDGVITGVSNGGLGGKVVWLKAADKNVTLYYAHLDKQLVSEGQTVKKGETLGLVGNTGNAKHTPSHLHFGVYTSSGPIDPFPFVDPTIKTAAPVPAKSLAHYLRLTKAIKGTEPSSTKNSTVLIPLAITAKGYIAEFSDGKIVQMPFNSVQTTTQMIQPAISVAGQSKSTVRNKLF